MRGTTILLAASTPLPQPKDQGVVAQTRDGRTELLYRHFTILMHRERRLALVCASNVTAEPDLKEPEPGRDYSRKGLGNLRENDQERWFLDPRLESKYQLPDVFFTKDRKAFDKGHIVRREDVAWGDSYDVVRRANGDTFHVTNCSPQVADFNQSQRGEDNWGDLENQVLANAASERLCVFAGPVLDPADEVFVGTGEGGCGAPGQGS
ncbi:MULTISPECIES: DNA/RNA non-specific endonuclease [unclassified Thiocapsa]|uniref:DNA/RNA non-specific endonuclease n=1 Tax=unclassified Thiocapsa TaxID=2641286 RepID=UPI0035B13E5A